MGKYMVKRILFSIFSLFVVVMVVMLLVYSLIDRNVIFQQDDLWNKKSLNDRTVYEYTQFQKYGYLSYTNYSDWLIKKYQAKLGDSFASDADYKADLNAIKYADTDEKYTSNASVREYIAQMEADGYRIHHMAQVSYKNGKEKPGGKAYLLAIHEKNPLLRLVDYVAGFITVETTHDVTDENLTERYIRVESDPYGGPFAVVGSGTTHKYLLYFNNRFPFIHQNWLRINLGTSFTTYRGQEITTVINNPTGEQVMREVVFPVNLATGKKDVSSIDFHSVRYNSNVSDFDRTIFTDNYTTYTSLTGGLSMLENSFVIGLAAVLIAYALGLPLGMSMARHKDKLGDKIGNGYIIFIMAVPSLAYIFMFAAIGTGIFGLPYKFATAEVKILAYILPVLSLSARDIANLMKWMRRYMIDQMNSDYVKFARAEGLSEKEIYNIHISRNALIYLVHGIPGTIIGCLTGAIITERVYSVPGIGNLLTTAINKHDNGIIVACTVFYTALSIISLILGDLLLAAYDPRISLNEDKGGGR